MKRFFPLLIAASLMLLSCSEWKRVPDKLEALIERIDQTGDRFTSQDWDNVRSEYRDLMDLYNEQADQYSKEDRSRVLKAAGRYHALMLKRGVLNASSLINDLIITTPEFLDGMGDIIDETGDNAIGALEDGLDSLLDYVEDGVDTFLEKLEDLFN